MRELTGAGGVDVVYDPVGGPYSEPALRSLGWGGRHLVVGFAAGEIPRIPLNLPLLKGCGILGVSYGAFAKREPEANRALVGQLLAWVRRRTAAPARLGHPSAGGRGRRAGGAAVAQRHGQDRAGHGRP